MENEINGAGSGEQPDAGNDTSTDSATGSNLGGDNESNGSNDPNSAISRTSRQARRKPAETGDGGGSGAESGSEKSAGRTRSRTSQAGSGSKTRSQKGKKVGLDLNAESRAALARQVAGIHKLVGIAVGNPALVAITDEQSEKLTGAALDVMQHYDMHVSPVVAAWANLAAVCATIYAPKFLMFNAMRKQQRAEQHKQPAPPAQPANVFDFSAGV